MVGWYNMQYFSAFNDLHQPDSESEAGKRHYRTIWLSDIHLGTRDCKIHYLLDFLKYNESEKLYLVGDIFDGWRLRRGWHWPQPHSTFIQKILRKSRKGTEVIFIPGNHDEFLRPYVGMEFGDIKMKLNDIHRTADNKRLFILHGDEFDGVMRYAKWLAYVGDRAYGFALRLNRYFNLLRQNLGLPYWSLSQHLKQKVKQAVQIVTDFEEDMARMAKRKGCDGVVCGHIHHAEMRQIGDIMYYNDGDWVESCTALVEHFDGTMEIIYWTEELQKLQNEIDHQLQLFT